MWFTFCFVTKKLFYHACFQHIFEWLWMEDPVLFECSVGEASCQWWRLIKKLHLLCSSSARGTRAALLAAVGSVKSVGWKDGGGVAFRISISTAWGQTIHMWMDKHVLGGIISTDHLFWFGLVYIFHGNSQSPFMSLSLFTWAFIYDLNLCFGHWIVIELMILQVTPLFLNL